MLETAQGLSPVQLQAITALEEHVLAVDGGRLKLEWPTLRTRSGEQVEDLLWWQDGRLVAFAGLYAFGGGPVEVTGMVEPAARRRGIATALLQAAMALCSQRQVPRAVLVVPRASPGGRALALAAGGVLERSEHALLLPGAHSAAPASAPGGVPAPGRIGLRGAGAHDLPALGALLESAFGHPPVGLAERLDAPGERTLVAELEGTTVGTVRLTQHAQDGGIYGLAVDPAHQGRGIGRQILRRACEQLRARGAQRIALEVAVDNDRALGLYTSLGFAPVSTEDYYALPVA